MTAKSLPDETKALLIDLLRQTIGARVEIVKNRILNQHHDYYALLVTTRNPSYELAIKIAGQAAPYSYPFDKTALFHRLVVAHTSIPMPEVIAVDVSYQSYPWRYIIKTFIPGKEWATLKPKLAPTAKVDANRQIGTAVAELHSIQFSAFGEMDDVVRTTTSSDYPSAFINRVKLMIQNERHCDAFLQLLETRRDLFAPIVQPRLCHEDLHHHNILFRQQGQRWRLATILDFDKAWAGHHEIDLAKLDLWIDMTGEGFWEAYNHFIPLEPDYVLRRPIYQLLWCLEYAANTPQHLADTQKLCRELHFRSSKDLSEKE